MNENSIRRWQGSCAKSSAWEKTESHLQLGEKAPWVKLFGPDCAAMG
jgi:hypothetical protein